MSNFKTNSDAIGKLILRVSAGVMMLLHGIHKIINGHDHIKEMLNGAGLPEILWVGVPFGEVLAPLCLILGFFTRTATSLIIFTMFMAIYLTQGWSGLMLNETYGGFNAEFNLWHLLVSVSIFFMGTGKWSLSEKLFKEGSRLKKY